MAADYLAVYERLVRGNLARRPARRLAHAAGNGNGNGHHDTPAPDALPGTLLRRKPR
jgi:hypothetical protein